MKLTILIEFFLISVILAAFRPPMVKKDPFKYYLDTVRCTRRYSVGACAESVVPVWTYVPHLQNCSERLGCSSATISNRFPTRKLCMERCKLLRDLYTMLIIETNTTDALRSNVNIGRRGDGPSDEDDYPAALDSPGDPDYPAPRATPDDPTDPTDPAPSAAPAQFHTEPVTQEEIYEDAPPEVEFWNG